MLDEQVVPVKLFEISRRQDIPWTPQSFGNEAVAISKPSAYVECICAAQR